MTFKVVKEMRVENYDIIERKNNEKKIILNI